MSFEEKTDYVEKAKKRQVWQWKGAPNIDAEIGINADRIQKLEVVLNQILNGRNLNDAVGIQLDLIGTTYGEAGKRGNRSDEEYRSYLRILPAQLRQAGQHEVLVQALINLTGATRIETTYYRPAAMLLCAIVPDVEAITNTEDINQAMQDIHAEGVRLDIGLKEATGNFTFSNDDNGNVPLNSGFASLDDGSDGGSFIKGI